MTTNKQKAARSRQQRARASRALNRNSQTTAKNSKSTARRPPARGKRRSPWRSGLIPVIAVVAVALVIVLVRVTSASSPTAAASSGIGTTPLAATVEAAVTHVPKAALDAVGVPSGSIAPIAVTGKPKLLIANNKPSVVYMGAEYCPYCATERWPLTIALSRFGSFKGLQATHSASGDIYPNTETLSYYGSTYTSRYFSFTAVEMETNQPDGSYYQTLQTPTAAENALIDTYDVAPYTTSSGSIPFIDFGDRYIVSGASFNPQILQGKTAGQIAEALSDPTSEIAAGADGTANLLTATLCKLTRDQPSSVCADPTIMSAMQQLK
jgi:thiol-disulfide isomerase/thioredoxin